MEATKLTEKQLVQLWREDALLGENDEVLFETVEDGEWTDGGKYQDKEVIFQDVKTGKHYAFYITRSGSYFSHYEYEVYDKAFEVVKETRTVEITEWVGV